MKMNMTGMTHFMIACCWAAGPVIDIGDPILVCQIIAIPINNGSRLNALPSNGSVNGKVNNTSGSARLSIHPKIGA